MGVQAPLQHPRLRGSRPSQGARSGLRHPLTPPQVLALSADLRKLPAGEQSVPLSCGRRRGPVASAMKSGVGRQEEKVAAGPGGRGRQEVLSSRPGQFDSGGGTLDSQRLAGGRGGAPPRASSGTRAAAAGASPAESDGAWSGLNPGCPLSAWSFPLSGQGARCEQVKSPILSIFCC